jgi:hypothetical protein
MKTLYFVNVIEEVEDHSTSRPTVTRNDRFNFSAHPYLAKYQAKYDAMTRVVNLEQDVGWNEAQLQVISSRSGIFDGFPLPDTAAWR